MRTFALIGIMTVGVAASAGAQKPPAGQSTEIPEQHRPPKGMCRIWLKDVPPAQQPAPTDCAAAVKNVPANGRVVFGDTEEVREKSKPNPKSLPDSKGYTGKPGAPTKPPVIPRKPPGIGH
ncbi:MAG TPA: hypothetical protein VFO55_00315 [Gemmatimonadaceae bacterium]|nr:hypothetical protein [Gemmatimonadaceae bacterium]